MTVSNIDIRSDTGEASNQVCRSAHGSGACLKPGDGGYAAVTAALRSVPTANAIVRMKEDLTQAFGTAASIAIPTMPSSFFPGATPIKRLAGSA